MLPCLATPMRLPPITFDESLWPLLVVRFVGTVPAQEYGAHLERLTGYLRRREQHVLMLDFSRVDLVTAEQRQQQVAWIQAQEPLLREVTLGMTAVVPSPAVRLAWSVVLHVRPLPVPYLVAPHATEAAEWVACRLDEAGLRWPAWCVARHFGLSRKPGTRH